MRASVMERERERRERNGGEGEGTEMGRDEEAGGAGAPIIIASVFLPIADGINFLIVKRGSSRLPAIN